ncbi:MAG: PIN domain-containing protein [Myxococcota bacterium]
MSILGARHRLVVLDTAPLIYFLRGDARRAAHVREILQAATSGELELVISAITEAELLVAPLRAGDPSAVSTVHALLNGSVNFRLHELTRPIARRAAGLRAECSLRLADALVAATGIELGCTALVSNDTAFRRLGDRIEYVHLDDFGGPTR